ncbi:alpha/beta hydrolase [Myceligenerans sp. I2]|uniref:Alpha/beta hydrolase n=2 Tax=Myceligenerans indicum TaxID=2593663 RepID=A0ABS1LHH4_9MICO|nr:alpha/beta hydrolase [Myceligenerans indicum]
MPSSAVPTDTILGSMTERGFRVITYSRAGYGTSSPAAGRSVADTAADCAYLLTRLGVERYLVVGWSAGGPHALASAAAAPESVEGVLVVASFAPFDAGGPDDVAAEAASSLPPVDLAVLTAGYGMDDAVDMDHDLPGGDAGWVADLAALTGPWGFDLDAVTVPVELWHGALDHVVPAAHGLWLAEHLPTAQRHLEPGHGHLSLAVDRLGEKLEALSYRTACVACHAARSLARPTARGVAVAYLTGAVRTTVHPEDPVGPRGELTAPDGGDDGHTAPDDLITWREEGVILLRERFSRAVEERDLPPDADPEQLARYVITIGYGIAVQAANGVPRLELQEAADLALRGWPSE